MGWGAPSRGSADRLALGLDEELPGVFWDAHLLLATVGLAGGVLVWGLSDVLLNHALKIPSALHVEARNCFHLIAVTIPVVVLANGFRGFFEAHQQPASPKTQCMPKPQWHEDRKEE